ncbi:homeobox transcription [Diplodia corticola]|uniref:Homeobox transcription n=1 Tax=Diplodia corticola TaxID=236234 RepID=A0A1J9RKW2_9PEZI|nr:homeobox transcription [Diplodia corticola]OJD33227.1 homeobox transcription [Diplodia corticola]
MSDPGSTTPPADATKLSSPPSGSLAFLVHSPDTVRSNLPPDVDNKPLARQKRRRTSPEDQKILEAEYQKDSKPDKAARLEIVKRVALGEKEVQIWFQNRRQNTRRKSKPLEPHEIQSHLSSSQGTITEPSSSAPNSDDAETGEHEEHTADATAASLNNSNRPQETPAKSPALETVHLPEKIPSPSAADLTNVESQTTNVATELRETPVPSGDAGPAEFGGSQPPPSSQESQRQGIGYLANRRSQSFIRTHEEATTEKPGSVPSSQEQASSRTLKKSSSFVRLSMSEDGMARVITGEDSPSPPRSQPDPAPVCERTEGLRRSYSAAALNDHKQAQSPQGIQRSFSGRSRDSRAWEFWCDSDARNSLTEKANQEGSGSAADAIGLIRSASREALKLNPNKRNAQLLPQSSAKRVKLDGKSTHRPPLSRSSSSQGRLQGKAAPVSKTPLKKSQSAITRKVDDDGFEIPQTESDKENWEPGVPGASLRRIKHPTAGQQSGQPRRRVLGENTNIMSTGASLGVMMDREKGLKATPHRRLQTTRTSNIEDDDEIRAFMGGAGAHSQRTSVSSGEELGCVEGLLKLSQGNWR